jgi:hypothetical protein
MSLFNKVGKSFDCKLVSHTLAIAVIGCALVILGCLFDVMSVSQLPVAAYMVELGFVCVCSPLVAVIVAFVRGFLRWKREVFNRRFVFTGSGF